MSRRGEELPTALEAARFPSIAVRLAVLTLPRGPLRNRYRQELLAELYGMPRSRQRRHALGVLRAAWPLRSALLDQQHAKELAMSRPRRPVMCRLNLHHSWRTRSTEDGARYVECARCGKDRRSGGGPGDWAAGIGAGGAGPG